MKKALKTLSMIPLFVLGSCGNETKILNEAEAKDQIASMKAEIQKDDFAIPSLGMVKTTMVSNEQNSSFTISLDVRFNTNVGSRYVYCNITSENSSNNSIASSVINYSSDSDEVACLYEKDGKYFDYGKRGSKVTFSEIKEEAEFKTLFDNKLIQISADSATLKTSFVTVLDRICETYDYTDGSSNAENNIGVAYEITFTKINAFSFKFESKAKATDSASMLKNSETTMIFENYLPKSSYSTSLLGVSGTEITSSSSRTYAWGSVEYIYPEASK